MKSVPAVLLALLPLLLACPGLQAQPAPPAAPKANGAVIWKWRDAQGHVVASDRAPPVDVPESRILQRPGGMGGPNVAATGSGGSSSLVATPLQAVAPPPGASAPSADPQLEARRRKAQEEAQAQAQQAQQAASRKQAADKADSCRRARANLAALESGRRISRPNEKGEPVVMDDQARSAEAERSRRIVADTCG